MGTAQKRLAKARKVRHRAASAFRLLESGQISVEFVLRDPRGALRHVDIYDIVRRSKGMGKDGAKHVCQKAQVWPHTRLDALSEEERARLIDALPPRARSS